MNEIKTTVKVDFPDIDFPDDFTFDTVHPDGVFRFRFAWFNGRWNGWCRLPDGDARAFGVLPNVISWTGFSDYGIALITDLTTIDRDGLSSVELVVISWG